MDPLALAAALAVLVAIALGVVVVGSLATGAGANIARDRLESLLGRSVLEHPTVGSALREQPTDRSGGPWQAFFGREWAATTTLELSRADLHLRVSEYVAMRLLMALGLCTLSFMLISSRPVATAIGAALAVVGYMAPGFYVRYRRQKRLRKLEGQLEELLTQVSNSLKAGFGLVQSLELSTQQMEHPIATELRRTLHDINIGSSTEEAFLALSERVSSYDLDIVVTAILVQRTVGGNLAEILETVARTMRERSRIRGQIRALTAQQRLTGYVLGLLPVAMLGGLYLMSGDYIRPLFTTVGGQVLLVGAGILEFLGMLLIGRILAIEV